jgi:hypothetical protein
MPTLLARGKQDAKQVGVLPATAARNCVAEGVVLSHTQNVGCSVR